MKMIKSIPTLFLLLLIFGCRGDKSEPTFEDEIITEFEKILTGTNPAESATEINEVINNVIHSEGIDSAIGLLDDIENSFIEDDRKNADLIKASAKIPQILITYSPNYMDSTPKNISRGLFDPEEYDTAASINTVIYVNGINTSYIDFQKDVAKFYKMLEPKQVEHSISLIALWNPSALMANMLEENIQDATHTDIGKDFWEECTVQKLNEWITASKEKSELKSEMLFTQNILVNFLSKEIQTGKNIIIVPHSQGNLYVDRSLLYMEENGLDLTNVHVIETGSPADSMPSSVSNDVFYEIKFDPVPVFAVRKDKNSIDYGGDPLNLSFPYNLKKFRDIMNYYVQEYLKLHNFQGAYLTGEMRDTLLRKIIEFSIHPLNEYSVFAGTWTNNSYGSVNNPPYKIIVDENIISYYLYSTDTEPYSSGPFNISGYDSTTQTYTAIFESEFDGNIFVLARISNDGQSAEFMYAFDGGYPEDFDTNSSYYGVWYKQ